MVTDNRKLNAKSRYVSVRAPARLHLGFLDMHGDLGRKFGSLGLSITNDIISSHGGSIFFEKSPLQGLRVKIFLPF